MQPIRRWLAVVALVALPLATPSLGQPAPAQATKPGIERLYIPIAVKASPATSRAGRPA